ncbi:hypothetical protein DPEC_G00204640 [Dallia pectoralis]|uniref:Uncharacterized protein n=1 Tax=Dallia pectoralis TaxID=75939 RepID=A0ACC2G3V8_DALPE|nr:hypothetical protein DPEC_G00204640 [Dallia pectoralis]
MFWNGGGGPTRHGGFLEVDVFPSCYPPCRSRRYWVLVKVCDGVVPEKNGDPPPQIVGSTVVLLKTFMFLVSHRTCLTMTMILHCWRSSVVVHPLGGPFRMFSVVKRGRVSNLLWETEGTNKAQTRLAMEHSAKTW